MMDNYKFTAERLDNFNLDGIIGDMDAVNKLVDCLNEEMDDMCYGVIPLISELDNMIPLLNDKIISPGIANYLKQITHFNNQLLDILEYGHPNLEVSEPMRVMYMTQLKILNKLINDIKIIDSLRGGNLLLLDFIPGEEMNSKFNINPCKFKVTDDMIDSDYSLFNEKKEFIDDLLDKFKEDYEYLF